MTKLCRNSGELVSIQGNISMKASMTAQWVLKQEIGLELETVESKLHGIDLIAN